MLASLETQFKNSSKLSNQIDTLECFEARCLLLLFTVTWPLPLPKNTWRVAREVLVGVMATMSGFSGTPRLMYRPWLRQISMEAGGLLDPSH